VAAAAAAVVSFTPDARADLLLSPATNGTQVLHEEVATTFGAPRVTRWSRLSIATTHGRFAWLVQLTGPSRIDLAGEAWLSSLESASAARVVPPITSAPCDAPLTPEVARWAIAGDLAYPADARIIGSDAALSDYATAVSLDLSDATAASAHATFAEGGAFVALFFDTGTGTLRTPTVRVSGTGGPAVGLGLGAGYTTSYAIGPAPAAFGGAPIVLDASAISWGGFGSNYEPVRLQSLILAGPGRFLVESARPSLFMTSLDDVVSVPSVASRYFGASDCAGAAESIDGEGLPVSTTCAAGALATVGLDACDESVGSAQLDAHTLRCGGDDFALALSGAVPSYTFLTRALAYGDRDTGIAHALGGKTTVMRASRYDAQCIAVGEQSGGGGGALGGGGGGGNSGGSVDVSGAVDLGDTSTDAEASSGDGCGSSSDSSSDSSSSGSSDGCGGSGSDTSSGGGDSCGGDSGGGGDACAGGGGDLGGGGDCSVAHRDARAHGRRGHGKRPSPVSRVVMSAALIALFIRRRMRVNEALNSARTVHLAFHTSSEC
jgi:hypothetical protein